MVGDLAETETFELIICNTDASWRKCKAYYADESLGDALNMVIFTAVVERCVVTANQGSHHPPCPMVHDERKTRLTMLTALSNRNACLSLQNYAGRVANLVSSEQFGWFVGDSFELNSGGRVDRVPPRKAVIEWSPKKRATGRR